MSDVDCGLAADDGHVVWEEDVWDAARAAEAAAALAATGPPAPRHRLAHHVARVGRYWDNFYGNHADHFFKDRAWLERDFPVLLRAAAEPTTLLEFGCGVGNAFFPLLQRLPHL
jgi:tRNAThr (cytosine32-N3)-methyltransferase